MDVAERIDTEREQLTPAERRLAQVVLESPEQVAFGTVADLAARAKTSGASVVRFANTLGYEGFTGLQESIQADLGQRLRPATARIRAPADPHLLDQAADVEAANVHATLGAIDRRRFRRAVQLLSDATRPLFVLTGEASTGIGHQVVGELAMLRTGVQQIEGNAVRVARMVASLGRQDVVLGLDIGRYDRWMIEGLAAARARNAATIGISDAPASPVARSASLHFLVRAEGVGPFDSYVGALALLDTLVAAVAVELRATATRHLDRIEAAWSDADALLDE
jgi:DNA-binding MurR/RpiR family transcriptional regulator